MSLRRRIGVLLSAAAVGFGLALVVPRQRWRNRTIELASGPWPPLEPSANGDRDRDPS